MSGRRRRFGYANVASTMALVIALGGTAYAAATVTSADIVDHTIKTVDVGGKAQKQLLPEARSYHDEDAGTLTGTTSTVIGTLALGKGNWVIVAKLWLNNDGGTDDDVLCRLSAGNDSDLVWGTPNSSVPAEAMSFTIVHSATGNERASLECDANGGTFHVFDLKLTGIEVGSLQNFGSA